MTKFRCESCRFKFESVAIPKTCPYCSRKGTIAAEESAEQLIKDIDEMLKE